jgi:hypothetical protein
MPLGLGNVHMDWPSIGAGSDISSMQVLLEAHKTFWVIRDEPPAGRG